MIRAGRDQGLQQLLHDQLGAGRVEGADQRHRDDALPQLDHRGGQLEHGVGLVGDDLLPGGRVGLEGLQAEVVDHPGEGEVLRDQFGRIGDQLVDRVLEREHAERRLGGGEPVPRAGPGQLGQSRPELAGRLLVRAGHGAEHEPVQVVELAPYLGGRGPAAQARHDELTPAGRDLVLVIAHVRGHPRLAAVNVHECTFLYIRYIR